MSAEDEARAELKLVSIAPLGIELTRDAVREAWDTFVKPAQDRGDLQSVEDRILMACLRSLYISLPPTEKEPDDE